MTSTDQRLLAAVYTLARDLDLDRRVDIERALRAGDHDPLLPLARRYLRQADDLGAQASRHEGLSVAQAVPQAVPQAMLRAADLAYTIRVGAQGLHGPAPSPAVWSVLVSALTVLVMRTEGRDARDELAERVAGITLVVAGL